MAPPPHLALAGEAVLAQRAELTAALVDREFARHPELAERYDPGGREKSLQDAGYHLVFLAQALALNTPTLFTDFVAWVKGMLAQRRVLASDLAFHLECLAEQLRERLPGDTGEAAASGMAATLEFYPPQPFVLVRIDAGKIEQVLNNLIGKALKFSHTDTRVRVILGMGAEEVSVAVQDQGQGIPEADIPKLFMPFGKISVRRMIEGHGGRIRVESEVGKGSTFIFTLPAGDAVNPEGA